MLLYEHIHMLKHRAKIRSAAAKAHEADWCTELVQRALGGEAAQ